MNFKTKEVRYKRAQGMGMYMKFKKQKNQFIVIFVFNCGYLYFLFLEDTSEWLFDLIHTRI